MLCVLWKFSQCMHILRGLDGDKARVILIGVRMSFQDFFEILVVRWHLKQLGYFQKSTCQFPSPTPPSFQP
jgi:hypothetical protein